MPCETISTDVCSNIGEKIEEVDQVLLQVPSSVNIADLRPVRN